MRHLFTLLIVCVFCGANVLAQTYEGRLHLKTQAEVDNVKSIINSNSIIGGALIIGGWNSDSDITNVDSLYCITEVMDSLVIEYNEELLSLSGLENLTSVDVVLQIRFNPKLHSLSGLETLTGFKNSGTLYLTDNYVLYDLCPLSTFVGSISSNSYFVSSNYINPEHNEFASSCDVAHPETIYWGDVKVSTQAEVEALYAAFSGKSAISGAVEIGVAYGQVSDIYDLSAFDGIVQIGKDLEIKNNSQLSSLSGLDSLMTVGWGVSITNNALLTDYCPIAQFDFPDDGLGHNFTINANGYDADAYDLENTCSGQLAKPELPHTFIPNWKPGEGGDLPELTFGEKNADFIGLYLQKNVYDMWIAGHGNSELILEPTNAMGYDSLYVEVSTDQEQWSSFMDNRSTPAMITDHSYPALTPNNSYYYRLKTPTGLVSNTIYVDRLGQNAQWRSTGFGGSAAWPPFYLSGSYRTYDGDSWINAPNDSLLHKQWFRVDPVTFEFIEIEGATEKQYWPTDQDYGYLIAATMTLDTIVDDRQCYASRTYMSYDAVKVPVPTYISNVTTTGFDLNTYYCLDDTLAIADFQVSSYGAGGGLDFVIDSISPTESCGVYRFHVDIPPMIQSIDMFFYSEESTYWSLTSADEFGHGDMLMWQGVVGFYTGDIKVQNQLEVNALNHNLAGYTGISGDFLITEAEQEIPTKSLSKTDALAKVLKGYDVSQNFQLVNVEGDASPDFITDLSPVAELGITRVAGDLLIKNTTGLSSLKGLEKIDFVNGNLRIHNNRALASLAGLDSVEYADSVSVAGNSVLLDYNGIRRMQANIDGIVIENNFFNPSQEDIEVGDADTTAAVIHLSGNLAFGTANVGQSAVVTLTISNSGNESFTISTLTLPAGFTTDWMGGTLAAGLSQEVNISFTPTDERTYTGEIIVLGDFDLGENRITVYGVGAETSGINATSNELLSIHPNPFGDYIVLGKAEGISEVEIISMLGKQVFYSSHPDARINTSQWESGVYVLHIKKTNGKMSSAIIVKK